MKGELGCLRDAHEHGAPWDVRTCAHAVLNGHLDCLRYAHEHGAPWDEWTCAHAASNGRLDCLRYEHEHGAPAVLMRWRGCSRAAVLRRQ